MAKTNYNFYLSIIAIVAVVAIVALVFTVGAPSAVAPAVQDGNTVGMAYMPSAPEGQTDQNAVSLVNHDTKPRVYFRR